jgi:hypothetical protein
MHFNFDFTAVQVLWTLTFAAHLVLLVVLMGRERIRRFPWFTTGIVLVTLRLLSSRLLYGRLPELTMGGIFIALADVTAIVALLVVLEMARRAFGRLSRPVWIIWILVLVSLGAVVLGTWGIWPAWKSIAFDTLLARLSVLQLVAQKLGLLADVLTIELGLLVVLFGRRYRAGWRSHVQQILIGLSTASLAQLAAQAIWQIITKTAAPHSMAEYERIMGLREKLFNANSVVYLLVLIWWIACLWIDEPGTVPATVAAPAEEAPSAAELPHDAEK